MIHFEELWDKCETFHKENASDESSADLVQELTMKLGLYSAIAQKSEITSEDMEKAKSRLIGEILLSLTAISLKDNINVFDALYLALMQHSIGHYSDKYDQY